MVALGAPLPWEQPGWREQVSAWLHATLSHQGIAVHDGVERYHLSRWSLVLRTATSVGEVYCKAMLPLPTHEPALTQALARWRPDCLPRVLGADPARGWLLTLHAGARLREVLRSDRDIQHWYRLLPRYATLQVELAERVEALLALGTPDRRPVIIARDFAHLLNDPAALHLDQPLGLSAGEQRRLQALAPRVAALCAELAGAGLPMTLHHGDLHDGNILVGHGRYVFFDWGNSCVAHPFFSLRTALKSAKFTFGWGDGAPELARLRDCYLEPWTRYASHAHLRATLDVAHRLGMISNALTWQRVLARRGASRAEDDEPVPRLLREFLAAEAAAS